MRFPHLLGLVFVTVFAINAADAAPPLAEEPYFQSRTGWRTPAPTVKKTYTRSSSRRPRVVVSAGVGYTGYYSLISERIHGPVVQGSAALIWGRGAHRGGIRLSGFMSDRMNGTRDVFFGSQDETIQAEFGGVHLGVVWQYKGLWAAYGWGALVINGFEPAEALRDDKGDAYGMPEMYAAVGYDLHLGRYVALQLGLEAGTTFSSFRGTAHAALQFKF
jgi:hypothetical protein